VRSAERGVRRADGRVPRAARRGLSGECRVPSAEAKGAAPDPARPRESSRSTSGRRGQRSNRCRTRRALSPNVRGIIARSRRVLEPSCPSSTPWTRAPRSNRDVWRTALRMFAESNRVQGSLFDRRFFSSTFRRPERPPRVLSEGGSDGAHAVAISSITRPVPSRRQAIRRGPQAEGRPRPRAARHASARDAAHAGPLRRGSSLYCPTCGANAR